MKPLSVVVCTRNRAEGLQRCLNAIRQADFAATNAELVLVNNASTDSTQSLLEAFAASESFPVTVIQEPKPGLSNARNAGLAATTGEVVSFTDDDCYVEKDYCTAVIQAFRTHPDIDYFGGRILRFDPTDSLYACEHSETFFAIEAGSFIPAGLIQGANMGFTRRLLNKVGLYDPDMGAGTRFRCEDVDYIARCSIAGFRGAHVPQVVVWHHHGRKEGPELEALKRENDYARGAYYAKLTINTGLLSILNWIRTTRGSQGEHKFFHEFRGALDYWRWYKQNK